MYQKYKRNSLIGLGVAGVLIFAYLYIHPPLAWAQIDARNFPLSQRWSQQLTGTVGEISSASDLVFARTIYALYALQAASGKIIWEFPLSGNGDYAPARALNKRVYVTDEKGLYALDMETGQPVWSQELPETHGRLVNLSDSIVLVNQVGFDIRAYDTLTGSFLWRVGAGRGYLDVFQDNGLVYIPNYGIQTLDARTGKVLNNYEEGSYASSSFADGIIYYTSGTKIGAFDAQKQANLWTFEFPRKGFLHFLVLNNILFITDVETLYAYKTDGKLLWKVFVDDPINPTIIGSDLYVMEGFSRRIRVFEIASGYESGSLRVSFPLLFRVDHRDMAAATNSLIFSRGGEIFSFGAP